MNKPLSGIKVVELSTFIAVPACARFFADQGADVIKIEAKGGDLVMTDNGSWVLSGVRFPSARSIAVAADETANVTVTYHEVASDLFADYITVRVIAADGTIHTETVFVAK